MIRFRKQRFIKLKFILAFILSLILVYQIWFVVMLIKYNTKDYRSVTADDFSSLSEGDEVQGVINKDQVIVLFENYYDGIGYAGSIEFQENPAVSSRNIAVADKNGTVFLVYAKMGELSGNYEDLGKLMTGSIDSLSYKGKVVSFSSVKKFIGISKENFLSEINESGISQKYKPENISNIVIELNYANETQDVSYLVFSIIGALLTLSLIVLLLWKSFNNFIYGYLVDRGKIEPELKIRREDLIIQNDVNYSGSDNDSDSFYVNAEEKDKTTENTNKDTISNDFHFTKRMRDNENNTLRYERKEPTFSDGSPLEIYSGGVNEDGNFYVDRNNTPTKDSDGEGLKKY